LVRIHGFVPGKKLPLFCRFRKFINQKGDIGFSDITLAQRALPLRRASATPMKSRAACGRPEPLRQTMPTCTTGRAPETSRL
jgi:hypothetical protein